MLMPPEAVAQPAPTPRTILTQDSSGAVLLWDATPYVAAFAERGTPVHQALETLKADAVNLFLNNAPALASTQHHLKVIVSFVRTGAPEVHYQTKTFEGVQTILTVEGNLHRSMRFSKHWQDAARRGLVPPGIKVEFAHDLPKY